MPKAPQKPAATADVMNPGSVPSKRNLYVGHAATAARSSGQPRSTTVSIVMVVRRERNKNPPTPRKNHVTTHVGIWIRRVDSGAWNQARASRNGTTMPAPAIQMIIPVILRALKKNSRQKCNAARRTA